MAVCRTNICWIRILESFDLCAWSQWDAWIPIESSGAELNSRLRIGIRGRGLKGHPAINANRESSSVHGPLLQRCSPAFDIVVGDPNENDQWQGTLERAPHDAGWTGVVCCEARSRTVRVQAEAHAHLLYFVSNV